MTKKKRFSCNIYANKIYILIYTLSCIKKYYNEKDNSYTKIIVTQEGTCAEEKRYNSISILFNPLNLSRRFPNRDLYLHCEEITEGNLTRELRKINLNNTIISIKTSISIWHKSQCLFLHLVSLSYFVLRH